MTEIEDLQAQARRIGVVILCPECSFEEPLADFLDRDEQVNEDDEEVIFECPACESDTVDLVEPGDGVRNIIVTGLGELDDVVGE